MQISIKKRKNIYQKYIPNIFSFSFNFKLEESRIKDTRFICKILSIPLSSSSLTIIPSKCSQLSLTIEKDINIICKCYRQFSDIPIS